jgi:hypothetical protein
MFLQHSTRGPAYRVCENIMDSFATWFFAIVIGTLAGAMLGLVVYTWTNFFL